MFYVVTLSLRTVSAVPFTVTSHSLNPELAAAVVKTGQSPMQHKVNEELINGLLLGLSRPIPDHITFPHTRPDALPARLLLFYLDKVQGLATIKIRRTINDTFYIGGRHRRIIADIERTTKSELRTFVEAGSIRSNVAKLRREDLVATILLGNYRKAEYERKRVQALLTKLEEKTEKLQKEASELEFVELKLADANLKIRRLTARLKDSRRDSGGQTGTDAKHRYPTRYSLTGVVEPEDV